MCWLIRKSCLFLACLENKEKFISSLSFQAKRGEAGCQETEKQSEMHAFE